MRVVSISQAMKPLAALGFAALFACTHAEPVPTAPTAPPPEKIPEIDSLKFAGEISAETHTVLRQEGDLLWARWTLGTGAAPSSALAGHERLYDKVTLELLAKAQAKASAPEEKRAIGLLLSSLAPQAIARGAKDSYAALDQARAQLAFSAPGDAKPEHSEKDLDRLLTDEPTAQKRAAIADAEALAAAPLAELALAREKDEEKVRAQLGLPGWAEMIAAMHGTAPDELAKLAEATLVATQDVAVRAVTTASERNLGQTLDRLHRADLPRLVRATELDAELVSGKGWENARSTFATLQLDPMALPAGTAAMRVDSEPFPAKASRPLALLVDPPADVRLSLKNTGGFDEQRAILHESARALGGSMTHTPRWELAQLGDGSASEGVAWLAESLSGDPVWLREKTQLRGEPLDDLVHTEAARRLLAVRRAAALVLFEVQRRTGPQTAEAENALYRSLLARATLAQHGEKEGARWPLETDGWIKACVTLRAALFGATLALAFETFPAAATAAADAKQVPAAKAKATPIVGEKTPAPSADALPTASTATSQTTAPLNADAPAATSVWWKSATDAEVLKKIWSQGRALTAEEAAAQASLVLDPVHLAHLIDLRLAYQAPEKPPALVRPDYKFMQGDRRSRHKKKKK